MKSAQVFERDPGRLVVATFNVNSIRARLHVLEPYLSEHQVDILCLQETKVRDDDFPTAFFEDMGYQVRFSGQKSYNGVAVASRSEISDVQVGFGDDRDNESDRARLLRCRVEDIHLVNAYVPQGRELGHPYFAYKIDWFSRLERLFATAYSSKDQVLWCGDLNVAPTDLDVYEPDKHREHVCFHDSVREAFSRVVQSFGFVDLLRRFHPDEAVFSFYDYRQRGAIKRGQGWRIDHLLATSSLADRALDCWVDLEPRLMEKPSDHTVLLGAFRR